MKIYLPFNRGFTCWPLIVLPLRLKGTSEAPAYLAHETEHYKSQAWWSPLWIVLYFLSKGFRWREEKRAFKAEILYKLKHGQSVRGYADILTGQYWGMCTRQQAEDFVKGVVKSAGTS